MRKNAKNRLKKPRSKQNVKFYHYLKIKDKNSRFTRIPDVKP